MERKPLRAVYTSIAKDETEKSNILQIHAEVQVVWQLVDLRVKHFSKLGRY